MKIGEVREALRFGDVLGQDVPATAEELARSPLVVGLGSGHGRVDSPS